MTMAQAQAQQAGATGGPSENIMEALGKLLGIKDKMAPEALAKTVAGVLKSNSSTISTLIKRQWPKIDAWVWLYIFISVLTVGALSMILFVLAYVLLWFYSNTPPIRKWIPRMSARIKELKVMITDPDTLYDDTVQDVVERARDAALRGSVEDQVSALLDSLKKR